MKDNQLFVAVDLKGKPLTERFYRTPIAARIAAKNKYLKDGEFRIFIVEPVGEVTSINGKSVGEQ